MLHTAAFMWRHFYKTACISPQHFPLITPLSIFILHCLCLFVCLSVWGLPSIGVIPGVIHPTLLFSLVLHISMGVDMDQKPFIRCGGIAVMICSRVLLALAF